MIYLQLSFVNHPFENLQSYFKSRSAIAIHGASLPSWWMALHRHVTAFVESMGQTVPCFLYLLAHTETAFLNTVGQTVPCLF